MFFGLRKIYQMEINKKEVIIMKVYVKPLSGKLNLFVFVLLHLLTPGFDVSDGEAESKTTQAVTEHLDGAVKNHSFLINTFTSVKLSHRKLHKQLTLLVFLDTTKLYHEFL